MLNVISMFALKLDLYDKNNLGFKLLLYSVIYSFTVICHVNA